MITLVLEAVQRGIESSLAEVPANGSAADQLTGGEVSAVLT